MGLNLTRRGTPIQTFILGNYQTLRGETTREAKFPLYICFVRVPLKQRFILRIRYIIIMTNLPKKVLDSEEYRLIKSIDRILENNHLDSYESDDLIDVREYLFELIINS